MIDMAIMKKICSKLLTITVVITDAMVNIDCVCSVLKYTFLELILWVEVMSRHFCLCCVSNHQLFPKLERSYRKTALVRVGWTRAWRRRWLAMECSTWSISASTTTWSSSFLSTQFASFTEQFGFDIATELISHTPVFLITFWNWLAI